MIHGWLILTEACSWKAHIDDRGGRSIHREREFLHSKGLVPKLYAMRSRRDLGEFEMARLVGARKIGLVKNVKGSTHKFMGIATDIQSTRFFQCLTDGPPPRRQSNIQECLVILKNVSIMKHRVRILNIQHAPLNPEDDRWLKTTASVIQEQRVLLW